MASRAEVFAGIRWVFSNGRSTRPGRESEARFNLAASIRKGCADFSALWPIMLADDRGWGVTDTGDHRCGPEQHAQLRRGIVAVAHHDEHTILEMRIGHRLCEGELIRAKLPVSCAAAWLLLEELYFPADSLAYLTPAQAANAVPWAPPELLAAFAARHAAHDRRRTKSWPAMAAVIPLRRIG